MTTDIPTTMPFKFRFWLAFSSLFAAVLFATLAFGAITVGEGLAEDASSEARMLRLVITFDALGIGLFGLAIAALWCGFQFFMRKDI